MKINSKDDIIDYFKDGFKEKLFIGVENEKFLIDNSSGKRINYKQTLDVLNFLKTFGWTEVKEKENLIGLSHNGKSITLEPGNQIELAGGLCKNIHEVCLESYNFQDQLNKACEKYNLKTISIGHDPSTKTNDVPSNPKERYKIMTSEMPKNGSLSLNMMYQTAGTQINLDYESENDFKKKFKLISYLTPLTIALFANSPIAEGKKTGFLSYRSKVWQNTSRGGLPKIFLEDMDFEKYADFALNYPLLFIYRDNKYLEANGKSFKDLLSELNMKDFELHLSTIFTELRLKKYIEIRSLDACEWDCHCAGPAFFTGLIYGNLDKALEIINTWNINDVMTAYLDAPKKGLNTEIGNKKILEWAKVLNALSKEGLEKRNILNTKNNNETVFLKNINKMLDEGKTKADFTLENI